MAKASTKKTFESNRKFLKQVKLWGFLVSLFHLSRYLRSYTTSSIFLSCSFISVIVVCIAIFINLARPKYEGEKLIYAGVNLLSRGICSFILDIYVATALSLLLNIFTTDRVFYLVLVPLAQRAFTLIFKLLKPKPQVVDESNVDDEQELKRAKRKARKGQM